MDKIIVNQKTIEEYLYTARRDNDIRLFWISIVKRMQEDLRAEVRTKPTYLLEVKNTKETHSKFKFITSNASRKLQDYLDGFVVIQNS